MPEASATFDSLCKKQAGMKISDSRLQSVAVHKSRSRNLKGS